MTDDLEASEPVRDLLQRQAEGSNRFDNPLERTSCLELHPSMALLRPEGSFIKH
jgi:hypothetical protein